VGTLFLVRHAHAGSRSAWDRPDHLRPLSDKGDKQAAGIRDLLAREGIARLLSSPAVRCVETMGPLAEELGCEVEVDERLAEGTPVWRVLELLSDLAALTDGPVALCSHGDVIPAVLDAQLAAGMAVEDDLTWPKASTWALAWDGTRATRARYLPPPSD
jgi:broad specificity phosphatase PhoE